MLPKLRLLLPAGGADDVATPAHRALPLLLIAAEDTQTCPTHGLARSDGKWSSETTGTTAGDKDETTVLTEFLPILLLLVLASLFAVGSLAVSSLVGPRAPNPTKLSAYECGNEPLADIQGTRFSVKFYMVAMLFLVFDIEAVFVYPWAVVYRELGWFGLGQMAIFIGILGVAFIYEIGRGGLEWD